MLFMGMKVWSWLIRHVLQRLIKSSVSEYGLPIDEQELDRIDMAHTKYYILLDQHRFLAPIGDSPQKILELGCGTGMLHETFEMVAVLNGDSHNSGIWSIDIADQFPSAEVRLPAMYLIWSRWHFAETFSGHRSGHCACPTTMVSLGNID